MDTESRGLEVVLQRHLPTRRGLRARQGAMDEEVLESESFFKMQQFAIQLPTHQDYLDAAEKDSIQANKQTVQICQARKCGVM